MEKKKPSEENLKNIDIVIFDLKMWVFDFTLIYQPCTMLCNPVQK